MSLNKSSLQPVSYINHDVNHAFEVLKKHQTYKVESLGGTIIRFRQEVFVTDSLTFDFIKFCTEFINKHPEIKNVADLGTGSGVIGVTLAGLYADKSFAGFDISGRALELAKQNAKANSENNIYFFKSKPGQWIPKDYKKPVDLIISNPPFIGSEEWSNPKFLEKYPDCKGQPIEALKTEDKYGVSEYLAITETAIERNVCWIIFRLNSSYKNELINTLNKYKDKVEILKTEHELPILVLKLN